MKLTLARYNAAEIIGLPKGPFVPITNSEVSSAACARRWFFGSVARLDPPAGQRLRYGTLWHGWMDEVHRWWRDADSPWPVTGAEACPFCTGSGRPTMMVPGPLALALARSCEACGGTGAGYLQRVADDLQQQRVRGALWWDADEDAPAPLTEEVVASTLRTLERAINGWLVRYGRGPYARFRVAAVEVSIARVVTHPDGSPYCPDTLVVEEPGGALRLAEVGEAQRARVVRWPWVQVGRCDAILADRKTGALWVGEWKSSAAPKSWAANVLVDPQTSGYAWMLDAVREHFGGGRPVGVLFDVTSNAMQKDPEPLKAPKDGKVAFSRAKATVPTWRWRAALAAAGVSQDDYADALEYAATVDARLYVREWPAVGPDEIEGYGAEIFARVAEFAARRRALARAGSAADLCAAVPRTPICRIPGASCSFVGQCASGSTDLPEGWALREPTRWMPGRG